MYDSKLPPFAKTKYYGHCRDSKAINYDYLFQIQMASFPARHLFVSEKGFSHGYSYNIFINVSRNPSSPT